ncbi:hypothetical protein GIR22_25260 [Pseudomonas sp. CCM 7891]|uniref:Uncharacterized protein n=1 Tax=Pseudomonas karstica TaxID=1055468 RepID=A0A7X2RWI6_9PSED|nr:hypothetical protein [Pseudomonas karstica]MTD22442.1 hypothetical protein [Pseudomonas karstica]
MRTVRDPSLSLSSLSGVDPEGPVMVEIPPVVNPGGVSRCALLAGSRIGFACEYVSGNDRQTAEHTAHFTWVLKMLGSVGVQLVPVSAQLGEDTRYFTLDSNNEIDDRVTQSRLDALVSDEQSAAFHQAATLGNPGICVSTGKDANGAATFVWFYGAGWVGDRLAVLVQAFEQVLENGSARAAPGLPTPAID